jgi:hypothetical protein
MSTLTYWENLPEMSLPSALFTEKLTDHYAVLKSFFNNTDTVLDISKGSTLFATYVPNTTQKSFKEIDLNNSALSLYNTIHMSETVGYLDNLVIEQLISLPNITKIVIKDFLCDKNPYGIEEDFSYDFTKVNNVVLPLLEKYNYTLKINKQFDYQLEEFLARMKNVGFNPKISYFYKKYYPFPELTMIPIFIVAER